jgi:hypothetical protein
MAATIDFSSLTLNNEEARDTSEVVFEQVFSAPEIANCHGIQTGVQMNKYIPILGQYGLVGKVDPGTCASNTITGQIPTSNKLWVPDLISGRIAHCQEAIPSLLKFWKKDAIANKRFENVDNEMMAFISDRLKDAMKQSVLRISSFGDVAADVIANGGVLTAGTDKTFFNMQDGLWKQIFTDQALGVPLSKRHTILENAGVTYAAQLALAADACLQAMRYLYENIDSRAFDGGTIVFQMTKSLLDNWKSYLEDKSLVFQLDRVEQGASQYSYRGIPIVERKDWDRFIRTYENNAVSYNLPHRIILSDINNIPIGTSDEGSLSAFDSFYDKVTKYWYMDFAYTLDQKNLIEEVLAVGY